MTNQEKKARILDSAFFAEENDHPLTSLLPYSIEEKEHGSLTHGLTEFKLLCIVASEALTAYIAKDLSKFDALVGENACQIRATLLCFYVKYDLVHCKETLGKINSAILTINLYLGLAEAELPECSLYEFLSAKEIDIELSTAELFLISSYILTLVRVILPPDPERMIVRNEKTCSKVIKNILPIGSTFAREFVKKNRKILSEISVHFVQVAAEHVSNDSKAIQMVSDKYCIEYNKFGRLSCLPCFWYTDVLLLFSLEMKIPITIIMESLISDESYKKCHSGTVHYRVKNGKYVQNESSIKKDEPSLVIHGSSYCLQNEIRRYTEWWEHFLSFDPVDLILYYAASHRQYPDENQDSILTDSQCERWLHFKAKAEEIGCTLENPKEFFLVHAYCDYAE